MKLLYLILLMVIINFKSYSKCTNHEDVKTDTLFGFLNSDNLKDYIIKTKNKEKIKFEVYLNTQSGYKKVESANINSNTFSDENYFQNADIYNPSPGSISILGFCCGNWKTVETFLYQYNEVLKTWLLTKTYTYGYNQDYTVDYTVEYPDQAITIAGNTIQNTYIENENERIQKFKQLLPRLVSNCSLAVKNKQKKNVLKNYPLYIIMDMVKSLPVTTENLTNYNDLGFYLQQTEEDQSAVFILEEVVEKFPERMVAYINLGDAYWDLESYEKATKAYNTYISLMTKSGKQAKIPKRVYGRVK